MTTRVTIIDYGVGNLFSVRRAVEVSGDVEVSVSAEPAQVIEADRLILPGVGAFEDGMRGLRERDLIRSIVSYTRSGRPLLGICLGMQMLATISEEFGTHAGIDLVPGRVVPIPRATQSGNALKVPFIGWAPINVQLRAAEDSCLRASNGKAVYLVHSFHVVPENPAHLLAHYDYCGNAITAAIRRDNVTGVQFHPEKSATTGLSIMREFIGSDAIP